MRILRVAAFGLCLGLTVGIAGAARAASPQDPGTSGQINQCWGQIASGLAQYDSPNVTDAMHGGAMGMHSRSGTAAAKNGGFANNPIAPITQPRTGAGNVSKGAPHNTHPGDGGMGQHAVNNGAFFSTLLDPVTGTVMGGTGEPITCSLNVAPNIP
ncbi:hypothetical protein [Roseicella aerolata]|uniref:Secreted protein n=1 Tax=Roseicella aerolata TaxID=2883479 RepID=A0A9X1LDK3_9PROT|nr:hypothetical protein [Roseicella aerolata]MCB4825248.1 hypothetical protein [Roseicella aerolata]